VKADDTGMAEIIEALRPALAQRRFFVRGLAHYLELPHAIITRPPPRTPSSIDLRPKHRPHSPAHNTAPPQPPHLPPAPPFFTSSTLNTTPAHGTPEPCVFRGKCFQLVNQCRVDTRRRRLLTMGRIPLSAAAWRAGCGVGLLTAARPCLESGCGTHPSAEYVHVAVCVNPLRPRRPKNPAWPRLAEFSQKPSFGLPLLGCR